MSTVADLIAALGESDSGGVKAQFFPEVEKKSEQVESIVDKENKAIIKLRTMWATWILIFIGIIIGFDILLIYFYGTGAWEFKDSNVVIVIIADNFLKIIGLGILITNSLFKKIFR